MTRWITPPCCATWAIWTVRTVISYLQKPLGYDPDFIPFSYDYEHPTANNYLQTWYLAGRDQDAAESAVTAAAGKQQEVDDDYTAMQTRLSEVRQYYMVF